MGEVSVNHPRNGNLKTWGFALDNRPNCAEAQACGASQVGQWKSVSCSETGAAAKSGHRSTSWRTMITSNMPSKCPSGATVARLDMTADLMLRSRCSSRRAPHQWTCCCRVGTLRGRHPCRCAQYLGVSCCGAGCPPASVCSGLYAALASGLSLESSREVAHGTRLLGTNQK